jgi:pimeloyl-ACP methyl ester carboxylesterase
MSAPTVRPPTNRTRPRPTRIRAARIQRGIRTDDGARLALTILGPSGPGNRTAVLAHGWGAGRPVWAGVAERLARAGLTVVSYDQRGHGSSTLGSDPISVERLGEDLATVLAHVDARDAVVAGHSGGGFAAMSYATADPHGAAARLRGLVLVATAAHDQETGNGEVRMMGSRLFSWAVSRPGLGRKLLRQTMGRYVDAGALELNRRMFAATPPAVRADCFRSSRGMDLRAGLAAVRIPAVVLAGAADKVVRPELGRTVAEALPEARYEEIPNAGHMLPLEVPAMIARVIADLAD